MNRCIFLGNLTRDPELRVTPTGKGVAEFAIAVNRRISADKEEVLFLDCVAWEKRADAIAKYFTKGKPILVEGSLRQERWEDKNTQEKRSRLRLIVDAFHFVGGRKSEDGASSSVPPERDFGATSPAALPPGVPAPKLPEVDDDVPF